MSHKKQATLLNIIYDGALKKLVRKSTWAEAIFDIVPSSTQDLVQDVATEDWTYFIRVTL